MFSYRNKHVCTNPRWGIQDVGYFIVYDVIMTSLLLLTINISPPPPPSPPRSQTVKKSLVWIGFKFTFKGKKAEKVAMIKAQIGCLLYNSMEHQQPWQSPFRNVQQQVISSFSEVETEVEGRGRGSREERVR